MVSFAEMKFQFLGSSDVDCNHERTFVMFAGEVDVI